MRDRVLGIVLVAALGGPFGGQPDEPVTERVAGLIKQLGDEEFARREEASKALDAIGEPALAALRKVAASSDDAEVRRRAASLVGAITGRIRAAAARKELAAWQGEWAGDQGQKMTIKEARWISSTPTFGPVSGTLQGIEVREKMTLVDLVVEAGPTKGRTCKAILRLDGDTLHYCGTYDAIRPTEFKPGGNNVYIDWRRVKK
jgi:uncharacterized protein (TIGR03067 family)